MTDELAAAFRADANRVEKLLDLIAAMKVDRERLIAGSDRRKAELNDARREALDLCGFLGHADDSATLADAVRAARVELEKDAAENARLHAELDRKQEALVFVDRDLDYLTRVWGSEGLTRSLQDRVKQALKPTEGDPEP